VPAPTPETTSLTIGLVLDDGLDAPDGVQQYVLTVARELEARGHEVHLVASATARADLERLHVLGRNLRVRFNGNVLSSPLPARAHDLDTLLDEVDFDVLHVQLPHSPFLAGRLVRRVPDDVAVVGTFHILPESRLVETGTRALGLLERRTLARFDAVMAVSAPAAAFARASFRVTAAVVPNPVDMDRFPAPPGPDEAAASAADDRRAPRVADAARAASEAADERAERPLRVVFLGRLVARKGPRELVDAAAYVVDHRLVGRPWTLTLAGSGPLEDELRQRIAFEGLSDRVDMPGFVAEDAKAALLAGADLVVLPSTGGESFGISVVEAMAAGGGPVLAGDNPGYRSTMAGLEDQLVAPRDRVAFGEALARWLLDDDARTRATARQRAAARRFDVRTVVDDIEATYRRALATRRP
jgi:phosphatidylinositol alpha-mannosyltransferase